MKNDNQKKNFILLKNKKNKFSKKRKITKSKLKDAIKVNNLNKLKLNVQKKKKSIKKESNVKLTKHKIIFLIFSNLIGLLLFIISYYFYYLSLEKCTSGEDWCTLKWDWIKLKLGQLIISTLIIIFLIILIIYKIISKLHLFHFIGVFIVFYYYSHSV